MDKVLKVIGGAAIVAGAAFGAYKLYENFSGNKGAEEDNVIVDEANDDADAEVTANG
jgi:hypothetical protein